MIAPPVFSCDAASRTLNAGREQAQNRLVLLQAFAPTRIAVHQSGQQVLSEEEQAAARAAAKKAKKDRQRAKKQAQQQTVD